MTDLEVALEAKGTQGNTKGQSDLDRALWDKSHGKFDVYTEGENLSPDNGTIEPEDGTFTPKVSLDLSPGLDYKDPNYLTGAQKKSIDSERYDSAQNSANQSGFGSYVDTDGNDVSVMPGGLQDTTGDFLAGSGGAVAGIATKRSVNELFNFGKRRLAKKADAGFDDAKKFNSNRYVDEDIELRDVVPGHKPGTIRDPSDVADTIEGAFNPAIIEALPAGLKKVLSKVFDPVTGQILNKSAARYYIDEADRLVRTHNISFEDAFKYIISRQPKAGAAMKAPLSKGDGAAGAVGTLLGIGANKDGAVTKLLGSKDKNTTK